MTGDRGQDATSAELDRRWRLVRERLRDEAIDALVVIASQDYIGGGYFRWLTDRPAYHGSYCVAVFHLDAPMTVVEHGGIGMARDIPPGPARPGVGRILNTASFQSAGFTDRYEAELVVGELRRMGARRIALAGVGNMPYRFVTELAEDGFELIDLTEWLDTQKAVKSADELTQIRAVAELQDRVFAHVLDQIRSGMTDRDVSAIILKEARLLGSEQNVVLVGSAPLGAPAIFNTAHDQERRFQRGDHLTMLIEVNGRSGFYCELGRTISIGPASAALQDEIALAAEIQAKTIARLKPGGACNDIAEQHDDVLRGFGLPVERRIYAHGQGYDLVERPLIRHDETMALAAGMHLVCHPGFVRNGAFGFICDNYILGEGGAEPLHRTEQRVFEAG